MLVNPVVYISPFHRSSYTKYTHASNTENNTKYNNPLTAKLFNLNCHPREIVSRWRDPQLQVSENYTDLTKWRSTVFKYCWVLSYFIFNMFKWCYLMCK